MTPFPENLLADGRTVVHATNRFEHLKLRGLNLRGVE